MPELSVVIVNYNTPDYTAQCLESLRQNPPSVSHEIVAVDNASTDDSVVRLTRAYPEVCLVRSDANRGIAGGNNMGIRASTGKYVLLLNNDTLVLPGMLDRVVEFLDGHADAGGVGGQLLNPDGSFQSSYVPFPSLGQLAMIVTKLGTLVSPYYPSAGPDDREQAVDWMSTAFVLFRRRALEQVGFVDEDFFIYSDESDLQYRLKRAGWRMYYLPSVKTIHYGGKSLTPWTRRRLVYRGYLLYFRKHKGAVQTLLVRLLFASVSMPKLAIWWPLAVVPGWRNRAVSELRANRDVLRLSLTRGVEAP